MLCVCVGDVMEVMWKCFVMQMVYVCVLSASCDSS